jgi:hypothetical protein
MIQRRLFKGTIILAYRKPWGVGRVRDGPGRLVYASRMTSLATTIKLAFSLVNINRTHSKLWGTGTGSQSVLARSGPCAT